MQVTRLEPVTKSKYKVYLDEQFAFVLYKGELSRYKIKEGNEVSQDIVEKIKTEVLVKRAKLRAMHLLNYMDRTEQQLRDKLKRDLYPDDIIEIAMNYVASFGYVGDYGYTKRYVETKMCLKSQAELKAALVQKGISKEIIQRVFEECYEKKDELEAIKRIIEKKKFDENKATDVEKKKMMEYLLRKGFRYGDISQIIQVSFWNA